MAASGTGFLSGQERLLEPNEIIVSKTDRKGRITYASRSFVRLSGYAERELIGMPHNIVRHPAMPRCVFKLLWERIEAKGEVFAYVVNKSKNGDYYWVFAHVTPTLDASGEIIGYHSTRRRPDKGVVDRVIVPQYNSLLQEEARHSNAKEGMLASYGLLVGTLDKLGMTYDEFVFSL